MLRTLATKMRQAKVARRATRGRDITDPIERRRSWRVYLFQDHGILRTFWTNFGKVADGVYRSNHPDHKRFVKYKDMGIVAVLNLRGTPQMAHHLFEVESCQQLGLALHSIALHARKAAPRQMLLQVFEAFDTIPRPFVMHCKSGADRAGLASALYVLDAGGSVEDARKELSFKYLHLRFTKTGIQDHMLDLYEERLTQGDISIRDWVAHEYDPDVLTASFAKQRILPL